MQYRLILVWSFVAVFGSWVGIKEIDLRYSYGQAARVKKKRTTASSIGQGYIDLLINSYTICSRQFLSRRTRICLELFKLQKSGTSLIKRK